MNHSLGNVLLILGVYALASARVVRFINADTLFDPVRIAVARRARDSDRSAAEQARWSALGYWLSCPWCVSVWVCAATVWLPMHFADNRVVQYVGIVLAASMVIGLLAQFSSDEDIEIEAS